MKIVTIHQPEHLPYLGFFHKVSMVDTLILLDNVQYEKNYFQNRNRVNTADGARFVTIPVTNTHGPISEVRLADNARHYCRKNAATIQAAYQSTPYWQDYGFELLQLLADHRTQTLSLYNEKLLRWLFDVLGINVSIIRASELAVQGAKTDLLIDICHKVGATKYISGRSGRDYLNLSKFDIPVEFQDFKHPVYTQWGKSCFEPNMSVIDALFNVGPDIMKIIKTANYGKRKEPGQTP